MHRLERWIALIVFCGLLLAPALAWVTGARTTAFENRELAARPTFRAAALPDQDFYAAVSDWFEDHLPLRQRAVEVDARLDLGLFQDSPEPQVWLGKENWLFFDPGLHQACAEPTPNHELVQSIARFGELVRGSGRTLRWMIVPNKIALYPEFGTPRVLQAASCAETRRADLLPRAAVIPGFLDLHGSFAAMKSRFGRLLYFPDDSHLSTLGAAVVVQQLTGSLQPGVWDARSLQGPARRSRMGDLAKMVVVRDPIPDETYVIQRPGIRPGETTSTPLTDRVVLRRFRTDGPAGSLIHQRTFVLHDSQLNIAMAMMRQYFADASFLTWKGFEAERVAEQIRLAQTVVIEVVERDFYWRTAAQLGSENFLDVLESTLAESGPDE